jgi:DNA-binding CsgD family transcriptional regulator
MPVGTIFGRSDALAAVTRFLGERDRLPGALVIRGEAGIGKTTLWQAAVDAARAEAFTVLEASPAEAETKLAFAAVADLLERELEDVLPDLESPQRRALRAALLLDEDGAAAPDERRIAVAFLAALRALAARGPLLVALDDVQWLDPPSAEVLAFALRRLRDDPVALVVSERVAGAAPLPLGLGRVTGSLDVEALVLDGLDFAALRALVHERLGMTLARPALRRLHELAAGNPFAALEIGEALRRRGALDPGEEFPVPPTLHDLAAERLRALPRETAALLPILAALPEPTPARLEAATGPEVDTRAASEAAVKAGVLVRDGERLRFTHPLLASAAYSELSAQERDSLHRRLAASAADPEERGRHLALVAREPDGKVAASIDLAAEVALRRGAGDAAAGLYARARALTPPADAAAARRRLILEARCLLHGGDSAGARDLLEAAVGACDPGEPRAELLCELAGVYLYGVDYRAAVERARRGMSETAAGTPLHAKLMLVIACAQLLLDEPHEAIASAHEADELGSRLGDAAIRAEALAIEARARALIGDRGYEQIAARALSLAPPGMVEMLTPRDYFAAMQEWADDFDGALAALRRTYADADVEREETPQTWTLVRIGRTLATAGAWLEGLDYAEEGYERALDAGQVANQVYALGCRAFAEAWLGRAEAARASADDALRLAASTEAPFGRQLAGWALGLLELSLGRAEAAHRALAPLVDEARAVGVREPGAMRFVPDAVEALVETGEAAAAEDLLAWYEDAARAAERKSALALSLRCRGILAASAGDAERAVALLAQALERLEGLALPVERARTLLALGSAQRRARERRAARASLEEAVAAFEGLGARPWVERARAELARVGGRAATGHDLTPNEAQVAGLVAEGLTNKEVAARLFLSTKTVEFHLRNVFRKVGVKSRTELSRRLPETADP